MNPSIPPIAAVLDTNAMLELMSDLDVVRSFKAHDEDLTAPDPLYRVRRTRASLLMAMVLHERSQGTLGHVSETLRKFGESGPAPIDASNPGVLSWSQAHAWSFIHFVMPSVLSGWSRISDDEEPEVRSNDADAWLLRQARHYKIPLITNEGATPRGFRDVDKRGRNNLRGRAREAGVRVMSPIEFFWSARVEPAPMIQRFVARFMREAIPFAESHGHSEAVLGMLEDLLNIYLLFLRGTTDSSLPNIDVAWPQQ